ncbi:Re/Si-specific NAD(P)(+) transhydrogenase subunit alpha [Burkholderia multivorans]|uniref:Re/Si-specific NAD(P)(+) transhydrogenase subunit alpha n=1 Tax=Burkholderia multivorans TaxID=87883 RepID=UPI00201A1A98|nr:Re/Si-specific NAD(P)(+) transhydrogenase subunit alpha [Burkholderia multivorans]MCO1367024.1 Re/Si-specific NAD(P)(+) transhydrogenase subunit alpha [Burkholderia multivorans]MCO1376633.1 Re/Si-specific NAD(P)(+) transhydrogenase subunit alpha [Burkholderia multivorans]UQP21339.1 Re/Si-specific NAD(P)(+) transhydrogenase subunit alpha [Burkholderia multivorans]UQP89305.1 Re/Si-specific NAD(P)(+) transhydrogenase subunit alpha [Burkholderia multivorans]
MNIGVPVETAAGETRVAVTPETAKKLTAQGHVVRVASGAGASSNASDDAYRAAGAEMTDQEGALGCELVLKVRAPDNAELSGLRRGAVLVGMLDPFDAGRVQRLAAAGVTGFALEAAPRTTRAQSLDVLSSQANIAGYKAVLVAAHAYQRFMPMLMTAAGTVKAARVLVLGAGVAGLQAIATAKRLGAVIEASDVRPAVKEQIESLGAKFIDVPFETDEERDAAQGTGGYARPMPPSWLARQAALVHERAKQADIVISTALIPGRTAPMLIPAETVQSMKPGSVIVDLAAGRGAQYGSHTGGNCPLTEPDRIVVHHGVTIIGHTNLPAMAAADASALYARNVLDFLKLIVSQDGRLNINPDDEIVAATLLTRDGNVMRRAA